MRNCDATSCWSRSDLAAVFARSTAGSPWLQAATAKNPVRDFGNAIIDKIGGSRA